MSLANQFIITKLEQKIQQLNLILLPEGRIQIQQAKEEFIKGQIDVRTLTEKITEIKDKYGASLENQPTKEQTTEPKQQFWVPPQDRDNYVQPFTEVEQQMFYKLKLMNSEERKNFVTNNPEARELLKVSKILMIFIS